MRIAINHTRFAKEGGIERYIYSLVKRLLADGHEVHCFVRRWDSCDLPGLHFHHVPALPLGEGIKVLTFAYASSILIASESFDVVHSFTKTFAQTVYTDGSGCFDDYLAYLRTASLWRRLTTFRPLLAFAVRHIERMRFGRSPAPRVLAMSAQTRDQILRRHSFPGERIDLTYSGVDTTRFSPCPGQALREDVRSRVGAPREASVALLVGNDFRRKGVDTAIEAVSTLERRGFELWVVGGDRRLEKYVRLARRRKAPVRFLGPQASPEEFLAAADLFLFPSRYDVFGNAALEAFASGLASVVSSRAGVCELVEHGRNGLVLLDPEDPGELARHILRLADPTERHRLGVQARVTAEKFAFETHYQRVLQAYETSQAERPARVAR